MQSFISLAPLDALVQEIMIRSVHATEHANSYY